MATSLVLYDGLCGLCDGLNRFLIRHDARDRLRFAPLQGPLARELLLKAGLDPDSLDTFFLVEGHGSDAWRIRQRSDAALAALQGLGGLWRGASLLRVVPRPLRDALYRFVSSNRYRWFARYDECPVPAPAVREKFVGL